MGSKKGVKKRPTTERDRLYRLVLGLREDGLSYNQIIKRGRSRVESLSESPIFLDGSMGSTDRSGT
jgi:hypothetical protein